MQETKSQIILTGNLQAYFFEGLQALNRKSLCPVPDSILFYSSDVLGKFSLSTDFFEVNDGKVREKILGIKLLEATQLSKEEQRKVYKDVADMSLMVCGYFSESVNKKIVDVNYYAQIGKTAFTYLNNLSPKFLDIPHFYGMVATCFESTITLLSLLAGQNRCGENQNLIFKKIIQGQELSDRELLSSGVIPDDFKKVS
jgi:hypothetical protein